MTKGNRKVEYCSGKDWEYSEEVTKSRSCIQKYPNCKKFIDEIIEKDYSKHKKAFNHHIGIDGDKLEEIINPVKQDTSVDLIIGLKGRENNGKRLLLIECKFCEKDPWNKTDHTGYCKKYNKTKELFSSEIHVCERYIILCTNEGRRRGNYKQEEEKKVIYKTQEIVICFYSPKRLYDKYFK